MLIDSLSFNLENKDNSDIGKIVIIVIVRNCAIYIICYHLMSTLSYY